MSLPAPLDQHRESVRQEWIDYNGHLNVAYYGVVFDHATDVFFDHIGLDDAYRQDSGCSTFAVETHTRFLREARLHDVLRVTTQFIAYDEIRLHFFHRMYHQGEDHVVATYENLSLHVDMSQRRVAPMPPETLQRLEQVMAAHRCLPVPEEVGQGIAMKRG